MKVHDDRLSDDTDRFVRFEASPNTSGVLEPKFLVMHYTAGGSLDGAVRTLTSPAARASAHLVIDRDGAIVQLVEFNTIAWHAGRSRWQDFRGLNASAIGIELVNAGRLSRSGQVWRSWFGASYDDEDVIVAKHRNDTDQAGWQRYPQAQIEAAMDVSRTLMRHYRLQDILGHDDIAPGRKSDPGPAFPMASFRDAIVGRAGSAEEIYETTANLNVRSGPGTQFGKVRDEPLARSTKLIVLSSSGHWFQIEALNSNREADLTGWVHGDYIRAT